MHPAALVLGVFLVLLIYWEAFETLIFPRRVSRRFRLTRVFYRATWVPWRAIGIRLRPGKHREDFLSVYGPISFLFLLVIWIALLIFAFALLHWGSGSRLQTPAGLNGFTADLLLSGATLFTLSLESIAALSYLGRVLTIVEAGTGLAFLAMVVSYLPVLYQAFSRREAHISLLDARAGSPPSAGELLRRHIDPHGQERLAQLLEEWDRWSADLLETHISYPVLAYYRSQHDNQSWVAALTTILDVCALLITGAEGNAARSARFAFAMARHAAADLSRIFRLTPLPAPQRLSVDDLANLRRALVSAGLRLRQGPEVDERLERLRGMYEPYMNTLGEFLLMRLPTWTSPQGAKDNWQSLA